MNQLKIKNKIVEAVYASKNDDLILQVAHLMNLDDKEQIPFPQYVHDAIRQSEADYKHGNLIPNEELQNDIKKWLEKQDGQELQEEA